MKCFAILCCLVVSLGEIMPWVKQDMLFLCSFPLRKCEEHFLHREVNKEAAMNSKTLLLAQVGRRDSRPDLKNKHAFVKIMSAYTRSRSPGQGFQKQCVVFGS